MSISNVFQCKKTRIKSNLLKDLTSVFLPANNKFGSYSTMPLFSIVSDLCAHPSFKLLSCRSLPQFNKKSFQNYSTDLLLKYMHQLNHTGAFNEDQGNLNFKKCSNYAFARSVYYRGRNDPEKLKILNDDVQFSTFLDPKLRFSTYSSATKFGQYEDHLTVLSNDQSWLGTIDDCVEKSWSMYCNNGYIHNYARHGVDKDDFCAAFAQTEQIIHSYKSLCPY